MKIWVQKSTPHTNTPQSEMFKRNNSEYKMIHIDLSSWEWPKLYLPANFKISLGDSFLGKFWLFDGKFPFNFSNVLPFFKNNGFMWGVYTETKSRVWGPFFNKNSRLVVDIEKICIGTSAEGFFPKVQSLFSILRFGDWVFLGEMFGCFRCKTYFCWVLGKIFTWKVQFFSNFKFNEQVLRTIFSFCLCENVLVVLL